MRSKQTIKKICEHCGNEFDAGKTTVRYCSLQCNRKALKDAKRKDVIRMTEALTGQKKVENIASALANRPYLNISETAKLLGVCRQTVYNLAHAGKIKAVRVTRRLTIVSRGSIDELIESNTQYEKLPMQERKPVTDWYTLDEITEKYGIKRHRIRKIINTEGIPESKDGTRTLIAKNKIDAYFKKQGFDRAIVNMAEWYTVAEIMEQYKMTEQGIYTFISRYKVPKKQENGNRYYSKQHIDNLKRKDEKDKIKSGESYVAV